MIASDPLRMLQRLKVGMRHAKKQAFSLHTHEFALKRSDISSNDNRGKWYIQDVYIYIYHISTNPGWNMCLEILAVLDIECYLKGRFPPFHQVIFVVKKKTLPKPIPRDRLSSVESETPEIKKQKHRGGAKKSEHVSFFMTRKTTSSLNCWFIFCWGRDDFMWLLFLYVFVLCPNLKEICCSLPYQLGFLLPIQEKSNELSRHGQQEVENLSCCSSDPPGELSHIPSRLVDDFRFPFGWEMFPLFPGGSICFTPRWT